MKKQTLTLILLLLNITFIYPQTVEFYGANENLPSKTITALYEDNEGSIWVGTSKGLAKIHNDSVVDKYVVVNGLPIGTITAITQDSNNNLWIGTSNGLIKYNGHKWEVYRETEGLTNDWVTVIKLAPDSSIYVGTKKGVTIINNNIFKKLTVDDGLNKNCIYDIIVDDNRSYYASFEGRLSVTENDEWTHHKVGKGYSNPAIILVGAIPGLLMFEPVWIGVGLVVFYPISYLVPSKSNFTKIDKDSHGNLWLAANGGGLHKYDGKNWISYMKNQDMPKIKFPTDVICDNDGDVWVCMNKGVINYDGENWKHYSKKNNLLPHKVALTIIEDKDGNHWVGTRNGLAKIMD